MVMVFNKVDLLTEEEKGSITIRYPHALLTSTKAEEGIANLIQRIAQSAAATETILEVLIPYQRGDLVSLAHERCSIVSEDHNDQGTHLIVRVPPVLVSKFADYKLVRE